MSLKYQQPYKIDLWERMIIPLYSSVDSPPLPAPVGNWNRAQFKMLIKTSFISSFTVVNAIFLLTLYRVYFSFGVCVFLTAALMQWWTHDEQQGNGTTPYGHSLIDSCTLGTCLASMSCWLSHRYHAEALTKGQECASSDCQSSNRLCVSSVNTQSLTTASHGWFSLTTGCSCYTEWLSVCYTSHSDRCFPWFP